MHRSALPFVVAVLLLIPWFMFAGEVRTGRVVKVFDGDSFVLKQDDGTTVNVRMFGIDAPEHDQLGGRDARGTLDRLIYQKTVTIETVDTDVHGRTVAWVKLDDGKLVNLAMVEAGWAWWFVEFAPDAKELADAEAAALKAGRGLWALKERTPPWIWRKAFPPSDKDNNWWLNTKTGVRHRPDCRYYGTGPGRPCRANEGEPCKLCGG